MAFNFFKLSRYLANLCRYVANPNIIQLKLLKLCWGKDVITEFEKVLDVITQNEKSIQVMILAENKHFCTGADLSDLFIKSKEGGKWMNDNMTKHLNRLNTLPIITYSAVDTLAVGGGAELACSTDFRVLKPDAYIQFVHTNFGILPGWGGFEKLIRIVGWQKAKRILYEANKLDSGYCKSVNLADFVVDNPELFLIDKYANSNNTDVIPFSPDASIIEKGHIKGFKSVQSDLTCEPRVFKELWMSPYHESRLKLFKKK